MNGLIGVCDPARKLLGGEPLCSERERLRIIVARLQLGAGVVDGAAVEPGRRAGFETGQAETQPGPLSSILPDAANLSAQPSRGSIDAVQTRQGWMIRFASRRRMVENTLIALVVVAFAWPLRKKALARKRQEEAKQGEAELPDDD